MGRNPSQSYLEERQMKSINVKTTTIVSDGRSVLLYEKVSILILFDRQQEHIQRHPLFRIFSAIYSSVMRYTTIESCSNIFQVYAPHKTYDTNRKSRSSFTQDGVSHKNNLLNL